MVLSHPLLTPDFNLLRVKVIPVFEVQNCFFFRSESKNLDSFCLNSTVVGCWLRAGIMEAQLKKAFLCHWQGIRQMQDWSTPFPGFWLRPYSLERTKIFCLSKSPGPSTWVKSDRLWLLSQVRQTNGPFWLLAALCVGSMFFCVWCPKGPGSWSVLDSMEKDQGSKAEPLGDDTAEGAGLH